MNMLEVEEYHS